MSDKEDKKEAERYKKEKEKYDKKVGEKWENFFKAIAKDAETIALINETIKEVKRREKNGEPQIPVKPIDELKDDREKLRRNIANKEATRKLQIASLDPPMPPSGQSTKKKGEFDFIEKIVKKGGIPVGAGLTVKPNLEHPEGGELEWEPD
jgi:hypothetical protein